MVGLCRPGSTSCAITQDGLTSSASAPDAVGATLLPIGWQCRAPIRTGPSSWHPAHPRRRLYRPAPDQATRGRSACVARSLQRRGRVCGPSGAGPTSNPWDCTGLDGGCPPRAIRDGGAPRSPMGSVTVRWSRDTPESFRARGARSTPRRFERATLGTAAPRASLRMEMGALNTPKRRIAPENHSGVVLRRVSRVDRRDDVWVAKGDHIPGQPVQDLALLPRGQYPPLVVPPVDRPFRDP